MANEFQKTHTRRIVALILLCVTICVLFSLRAFQFQIVNGAQYLADAQHSYSTKYTVSAARGEIVDTNGIAFTKSRATFNVELDYVLLPRGNDAVNETIYRLINVFERLGEDWIDSLPITLSQPYSFKPDAADADISRMKKKMGDLGTAMADYATAEDCLYWLYRSYGIQKYQENGKCTHCGQDFPDCDYQGYSETDARKIAGVRYEMLSKDFSAINTRVTFAEDISIDSVAWLQERILEFPGISVVEKAARDYVSGNVASHILGTVGPIQAGEYQSYKEQTDKGYQMNDTVGRAGIEKAFESELRGTNGEMTIFLNSARQITGTEETKTPLAGNSVQLTIDYALQSDVQTLLVEYIDWYNTDYAPKYPKNKGQADQYIANSTAASLVMLDVKTGGVLASVSYPYYDINDYINNYSEVASRAGSPLNNRALNGLYRPGSTFKPVVAAAALGEGLQTADTTILCPAGGQYTYYAPSFTPGCLKDRHGGNAQIDLRHALDYSCNVYFYDTGRRLGMDRMAQYANMFGLGVNTGLEIPSAIGRISSKSDANWEAGNVVQAAIGQMNTTITPLQMAVEAMTIANHGVRYETHLVKNILSYDGSEVVRSIDPVVASTVEMSDDTFNAIKDGMILAGKTVGAPYQLTDLGYSVAVKTGTPQKDTSHTHNAFICFAPADDPQIAIAGMVEDGAGTNKMIRRLLLAWEKSKNGGVLPERFQVLANSSSSAPLTESAAVSIASGASSQAAVESEPSAASLPQNP